MGFELGGYLKSNEFLLRDDSARRGASIGNFKCRTILKLFNAQTLGLLEIMVSRLWTEGQASSTTNNPDASTSKSSSMVVYCSLIRFNPVSRSNGSLNSISIEVYNED